MGKLSLGIMCVDGKAKQKCVSKQSDKIDVLAMIKQIDIARNKLLELLKLYK